MEADKESSSSSLSSQKPLLFVNYDASNLQGLPHRRAVFAHVQGSYHRWKKQKARSLRSSAQTSKYSLERASSSPEYDSEVDLLHNGAINALAVGPVTILQKGNSDPFSALPISVNPKVNEIFSFYRSYVYPSSYGLDMTVSTKTTLASQDWGETAASLHNKCTGYAILARAAVIMSYQEDDSELVLQATRFRMQSSGLLRHRLAQMPGRQIHEESFYRSIFCLSVAELVAKNFTAAATHFKILQTLLRLHPEQIEPILPLRFLLMVILNDVQCASLSLRRPCFDLEGWAPEQFRAACGDAIGDLSSLFDPATDGLDPSIDNDSLRTLFTELRETRAMLMFVRSNPSAAKPSIWLYIGVRNTLCMGRLVSHYADFTMKSPRPDEPNRLPPSTTHRACMQAYVSLAALYWARRVGRIDGVHVGPKAKIFTAGPIILAHLRMALEAASKKVSPEESARYAKTRLWALYVGAVAEQAKAQLIEAQELGGEWFTVNFAAQAQSMGVFSWEYVRNILRGFLYTDGLQPEGSQWFRKIMGPVLEMAPVAPDKGKRKARLVDFSIRST